MLLFLSRMRAKIIFLIVWLMNFGVYANTVDAYIYSNTIINTEQVFDNVTVTGSLYLENRGQILGDLFINDGRILQLQNSGDIYGTIHLGEFSQLVQIIETAADITRLNVDGNYSVMVRGDENIDLSLVMLMASRADKIVLNYAVISINSLPRPTRSGGIPSIELIGKINVIIKNLADFDGKVIMENVFGDGIINVISDYEDLLYTAQTTRDAYGRVYLNVVRITDYGRLLDVDVGRFINARRDSNPNDRLVASLDNAKNMTEFSDIIGRSVAVNPINLTRPIRTFHQMEMMPISDTDLDLSADLILLISESTDMNVAKIGLSTNKDEWNFGISAYAGDFTVYDDINDYSGNMYGVNLHANLNEKSMYAHSVLGFTSSSFNSGEVLDGSNTTYNPRGISMYGAIDIGIKYDMSDGFYTTPFVGGGIFFDKVLNQSKTNAFGRAGAMFGFSQSMAGKKYDYAAFAIIQSDDVMSAGVSVNFVSDADEIGGKISYAIIRDEFEISHKVSVGFNFNF